MNKTRFDKKTLEVLVYVANRTDSLLHIAAILYYADKYHLERYGRLITGDKYIPMPNCPVPSGAYDIINSLSPSVKEALSVGGQIVMPLRLSDMQYLSESDIECLNKAIEENAPLSVGELIDKVNKDSPYIQAKEARLHEIPFLSIVLDLPNGEEVLDYLNS